MHIDIDSLSTSEKESLDTLLRNVFHRRMLDLKDEWTDEENATENLDGCESYLRPIIDAVITALINRSLEDWEGSQDQCCPASTAINILDMFKEQNIIAKLRESIETTVKQ